MLAQEKVREDIMMAVVARTTMTMVAVAVIHGMMETTAVIRGRAMTKVYLVATEDAGIHASSASKALACSRAT